MSIYIELPVEELETLHYYKMLKISDEELIQLLFDKLRYIDAQENSIIVELDDEVEDQKRKIRDLSQRVIQLERKLNQIKEIAE